MLATEWVGVRAKSVHPRVTSNPTVGLLHNVQKSDVGLHFNQTPTQLVEKRKKKKKKRKKKRKDSF